MDEEEAMPNREVMSEFNYNVYCSAWCAVTCPEISTHWAYDDHNYAGDNGIVFG